MMERLIQQVAELTARLGEVERRSEGMLRMGPVAEVDPAKGTVRLKIGKDEDGADVLGPAIRYQQQAGALKAHAPPAVGQMMMMASPSGNHEQGIAFSGSWNDANKSPGSTAESGEIEWNGIKISVAGGIVTITGGLTVVGDFIASGGVFTHEAKDVGKTHQHRDVEPGGGLSGPPK